MLKLEYPGLPVPWARAGTKHGKYYTPEKQQEHRKKLAEALWARSRRWEERRLGAGPVGLNLTFDYSGSGLTVITLEKLACQLTGCDCCRDKKLKVTTPDLDNLVKQVMEALEDSGLIENDKQVASLFAEKIK